MNNLDRLVNLTQFIAIATLLIAIYIRVS